MKIYLFKPENREVYLGSEVKINGQKVILTKDLIKNHSDLFERTKKLLLVTEDGVKIYKKQDVWWVRYNKDYVDTDEPYLSIGLCDFKGDFNHTIYKYFSSRKIASDYVLNFRDEYTNLEHSKKS